MLKVTTLTTLLLAVSGKTLYPSDSVSHLMFDEDDTLRFQEVDTKVKSLSPCTCEVRYMFFRR
jgi:hypothetical protein